MKEQQAGTPEPREWGAIRGALVGCLGEGLDAYPPMPVPTPASA